MHGGLYRDAAEEGATEGTADGLNNHPDDRQGKDAESVPDTIVGFDEDEDLDDDGVVDP